MAPSLKQLSVLFLLVLFLSLGCEGRDVVQFPYKCDGILCNNPLVMGDCPKYCHRKGYPLGGECMFLGDTNPDCCCIRQ
ncbi:hypothetical protein RND81_10G023500 [Saponaria officinalis]|uniref:Uncharacterized protein n=1 Tax=Saponaria officinalis TaxID=3572 RepID=A0AAW1HXT1_SAPOF